MERGADSGFIKIRKRHVVTAGQGAAPRNEAAVCIVAEGLEFPHVADQFEVANAFALAGVNTNHVIVRAVQGQFI